MTATHRRASIGIATAILLALGAAPQDDPSTTEPSQEPTAETPAPEPPEHRVFASSTFPMDEILKRPYGPEVPFGAVGSRLWASSPQGWGFGGDVQWVYLMNLRPLDVRVRDAIGPLRPASATYYPSHVHSEGAERSAVASASFTFRTDRLEGPADPAVPPGRPRTAWSSGNREDWYAVDYGGPRTLTGINSGSMTIAARVASDLRSPTRSSDSTASPGSRSPWPGPTPDARAPARTPPNSRPPRPRAGSGS